MKSFLYIPVVSILLAALGGCSSLTDNAVYGEDGLIHDRSQDYEKSLVLPPIKVPDNLDDIAIKDLLVVPDVGTTAARSEADYQVPRPDFFYAEAGNDVVNLAREGREKYIIVDEPIQSVWQKMSDFWAYNNLDVEISDPSQGLMETAWIDGDIEETGFFLYMLKTVTFQKIDGPYKDKLRVSIKRADDSKRTAVRLQHLRVSDEQLKDSDVADWSGAGQDVGYKSEMMYALLHYLNKATSATTARELLAKQQRQSVRGLLGRDSQGNPVLKLTAGADKAWSWLDQAMASAEMDVGSSDRDIGKYYITFTSSTPFDEDKEGGFWGFINWLHGDREAITIDTSFLESAMGIEQSEAEKAANPKVRYSAEDVPEVDPNDLSQKEGYKIWLGGKVVYVFESGNADVSLNEDTGNLEHTGKYQIKMHRRSSGVYITVLTDEEDIAPTVIAEEILWNIKDHLPTG